MQENLKEVVNMTANIINNHVNTHPRVADSLEGIVCWWLPIHLNIPTSIIEQALEKLVLDHVLKKNIIADGNVIYSSSSLHD